MSGSVRDALTDVREWSGAIGDLREWSGDLPGGPGVIGRPSWMSGSGRESLRAVREW